MPLAPTEPILLSPALGAASRIAKWRWWTLCWAGLALLLLSLCLYQGTRLAALSKAQQKPSLPWFWQRFFSSNLPTRVVLPTPVFFSFDISGKKDGHAAMFRDTEVNEFSAGSRSPLFRTFVAEAGKPTLADSYTIASDTFASIQLTRYLDELGVRAAVKSTAEAPTEALDDENLIAIGTWGTLTPLRQYLDRLDFRLSAHEMVVSLSNPLPGEPAEIKTHATSGELRVFPGLVAFMPGMNGRGHLLLLSGRHPAALVSGLTTTAGLDRLKKIWKDRGSPEYFEVIVNAEMRGRTLVRAWPVALHPYQGMLRPK